ncbi:calcium-transporting ATPase 12, plasma membrane-type [Cajanus cajan]|uniref:Calcium-transporting ATPase 12, plasma membrane-type n=1 Tax=Cajanus cajan TaxID=3821 RepID=A0A151R388_CAJCA|nr:calcium-transporting ATPase 12, plasma membrane-type [Cajanus cajan]KYP36935.1 Putative calcium-transporting ATPase 12, plasma membrane-type [Cajanus cajan]
MSPATTFSDVGGDGGNIELRATATLLHTRIWPRTRRLFIIIRFLISVKKPTTSRTSPSESYVAVDIEEEKEEEKEEERIISDIARIVKEKDFKSLHEHGGVDHVANVLASIRLQPSEVDINGVHATIPLPVLGTNFSSFLLTSCKCYCFTILMLLISAGLSFAIGFKQEGPKQGWHDGVAIVSAILLLVVGSSLANIWRERKKLKLAKRKDELEFIRKKSDKYLMGDIVLLWPGDKVPADGLLVNGILVLAGPDDPIQSKHDPNGNPFLISGANVIGGQGKMVVASIENKTNLAEIDTFNTEECKRGLLERLIEKPISYIDMAALFISVLVAFVVLIRLIFGKDGNNSGLPEMKGKISISLLMEAFQTVFLRPQGRVSILTGLVTVAILCVQHGMPLVVTISLKCQIDKVEQNQDAVLNDLSACTTMGLVTVVCIDVSGGLVSKPMEVSRIWMGEKDISKVEESEKDQLVLHLLKQGVGLSVLAPEISLSPLYYSLFSWAETTLEMKMRSFTEENFDILELSKLNSSKEGCGVLARKVGDNERDLHLHWSGAASTILEMCSLYYDSAGERHAMENQKIKFEKVIKEMEDSDLEPIAFAYKQTHEEELEQEELILLGMIGLKYTIPTKSALENLRNAGNTQIKLVSEDDIMKVIGIARELGLDHDNLLEGKDLQDLNKKARIDRVDGAHVMGSFSPKDKLLMVQCLQEKGKVVAFIGTRFMTSHASILKVADVGIVHDSLSTIVDRDSYDISIKCFSALKPILVAGRSQYHNIQKFIQLQMTFTISGLVITLITTICTGDSPLAAFQLIWVNVWMCMLGGLMMVMMLTSQEQLANQPSDHRNQPIITKKIWKKIAFQVLYQASVSMILEFCGHVTDKERKVREAMIFNTFLLCQLSNLLNTMQLLKKEVFKVVIHSFCFLGAFGGCILMQVLVIEYAKGLADCMQLNATRWGICVFIAALSWILEWTMKNSRGPSNYGSESITSPSFYLSPAFPFLMFLVFPLGLIFSQIGTNIIIR